jgi:hypothetical protein
MQPIRAARAFARAKAGNKSDARIAMIAITTSNSMSVKARVRVRNLFILMAVGFDGICLPKRIFVNVGSGKNLQTAKKIRE